MSKIILALDGLTPRRSFQLARYLKEEVWGVKATDLLDKVTAQTFVTGMRSTPTMADVKLSDTPQTTFNRMSVYAEAGATLTTIRLSDDERVATKALEAADNKTIVVGVTKLTSEEAAIEEIQKLAENAASWGIQAIVCSGADLPHLNLSTFTHVITPGVRSEGVSHNEQKRVVTPAEAIAAGATHVVIGREIVTAKDPRAQARLINEAIASAYKTPST